MNQQRWWEWNPQILEDERESLRALGIQFSEDPVAERAGIKRLELSAVRVGDDTIDLSVIYPDLYPYFRFEVFASGLDLRHHQNPFQKNLCVMGRDTYNWRVGDTIGAVIRERLPDVMRAGRATVAAEVQGIEENQAEPFTDYYSYEPHSIVLMEAGMRVDPNQAGGTFTIGTQVPADQRPSRFLRGALLKIDHYDSRLVVEATAPIKELYNGQKISGRWHRLPAPPLVDGGTRMLQLLRAKDQRMSTLFPTEVEGGGQLSVAAAVFEEERSWRGTSTKGDGWLFACEVLPRASRPVRKGR
jgi:hypothetical protein